MQDPTRDEKALKIRRILSREPCRTLSSGALSFLTATAQPPRSTPPGAGLLQRMQRLAKRKGRFYHVMLRIFSPVMPSLAYLARLRSLLAQFDRHRVVLSVGSGPEVIPGRDDVIHVDLESYPNVDILADAADLPLQDACVDLAMCVALLEHVADPAVVVKEIHRVLVPGGRVFCYLPFIVPYHSAPDDYHRWTRDAASHLFRSYERVEVGIGAGPASGLLYVLVEWLATVLSLGLRALHDLWLVALMPLTAPLKLMDLALVHFPDAHRVSSGFYVVAEKGSAPAGS